MKKYYELLKTYIAQHMPVDDDIDGGSILEMLYGCYNEMTGFDNQEIKDDFDELYRQMNGKSLREMDEIIYPVCTLCRDHEKAGFIEGVKVGILLGEELNAE